MHTFILFVDNFVVFKVVELKNFLMSKIRMNFIYKSPGKIVPKQKTNEFPY